MLFIAGSYKSERDGCWCQLTSWKKGREIYDCLWHRRLSLLQWLDSIDVLQGMHFAAAAWDHVSGMCVANCFRHAGWQVGSNTEDNTLPELKKKVKHCVSLLRLLNICQKKLRLQHKKNVQMKILCSPSWVGKSWKLQMQKTVMNLHQRLPPTSSNASLQSTQWRVTSIWHGRQNCASAQTRRQVPCKEITKL